MLTFGELKAAPLRMSELSGRDVLIVAAAPTEVVVRDNAKKREATMIFQHETIAMMRAERAAELDKLSKQLGPNSLVIAIQKKSESPWDHITVGRATTSDILIDDPATSSVHAHFEVDEEEQTTSVLDVGSSNGTFVNRQQLQPHALTRLRSGDCVRFGQSIFYFVSHNMLKSLITGQSDAIPGMQS